MHVIQLPCNTNHKMKEKGEYADEEEEEERIERIVIETVRFKWTIKNFSKLNCNKLYSEAFWVENHPWRILVYPRGQGYITKRFSMYMCIGDGATLPAGCYTKPTRFSLTIRDELYHCHRTLGTQYEYNRKKLRSFPRSRFMTLDYFHNPNRGFIVNDTCIIVAEVSIKNHATNYDHLIKGMMSSATTNELVDFRGLCKVEKRFVQLLEEVCLNHPDLIEIQRNRDRTRKFIGWSFTALGRVLHFLDTKSVEDMNDDACNELQNLWEELKTFGFSDLTWLELHVLDALSMRNHMEVDDLQVSKIELPMAANGGIIERLFKGFITCFKTKEMSSDAVFKLKEMEIEQEGMIESISINDVGRYIWTIKNFSKLYRYNDRTLFSHKFFVGAHSWRIRLRTEYSDDNNNEYLTIQLCSGGDNAALHDYYWGMKIEYWFFILNQFDRNTKKTLGTTYQYCGEFPPCGSSKFSMALYEFYDPKNGFLVNDTCVVVAEVLNMNEPIVLKRLIWDMLRVPSLPIVGSVDFKGLCKIEKYLVQLLDEIFLTYRFRMKYHTKNNRHSYQNRTDNKFNKITNRSKKYIEWSFIALERVLHFLKTNSVKDMNDDACKEFQILWKELKTFGFEELSWMDFDLQSSLGLGNNS